MDFVPYTAPVFPMILWGILLFLCFPSAIGFLLLLEDRKTQSKGVRRIRWTALIVLVICVGTLAAEGIWNGIARSERAAAVLSGIEETYGVTVPEGQVGALDYPDVRPTEDFKVFGSFEHDAPRADGFERETVYLIWRTDRFELAASSDGEKFSTLVEAR